MTSNAYEIRSCDSCGLRYPIVQGHSFGTRCPACMGETRVLLSRELTGEPKPSLPTVAPPPKNTELAVLLDNLRSAWNVGSIFRSADGFGFSHAYLCGITPTPDNEAVTKTSLGAEDAVHWSYHKDAVKLAAGLKNAGWRILALEEDERAIPMNDVPDSTQSRVLIVGNEVTGVDPGLLDLCDEILYIPMRGRKRSFNVAIAFSLAAYALR